MMVSGNAVRNVSIVDVAVCYVVNHITCYVVDELSMLFNLLVLSAR